jgi:tetratricopeptide (TPR) repeat protein
MDIVSPSDAEELQNLMFTAQQGIKHPLAIRYPRGYTSKTKEVYDFKTIPWGKGRLLKKGTTIAILSLGTLATIIEDAIKPGGALVDFQSGRNTLTGATNKQLGLMQNSWGLALKRAGRLEEAMKAYQLSLTTDPNNDTRKNMQCCQSAMWHVPQTNPTKGQLQKEYAEDKKVTNFNICGLPSCAKTGKKSEFKVCSRCKRAKYCCVEHQKAHWKEHKVVCKRTKNQDDGT